MIGKNLIKTNIRLLLYVALSWQPVQAQYKVVGYLPNSTDNSAFVRNLDFEKLTHINIAFENPDAAGNLSFAAANNLFIQLAHAKNVKVLVSVGGGAVSSNPALYGVYFNLISDAQRAGFINKIVAYLVAHQLDGIDVDLEGAAINGDYEKFIVDLSNALKPKGLLVTAALAHHNGGDAVPGSTFSYFDFINVMAYDETGPWAPTRTGQHASLAFTQTALDYWVGRGLPKQKAVLGVPFYGYGFNADFNQGLGFAEIIKRFPGAENQDQVGNTIYYNGVSTIRAKAEYVVAGQYGGMMIWQLAQDAAGDYSLLQTIHRVFSKPTGLADKSPHALAVTIYPTPNQRPSAGYLVFPANTRKVKIDISNATGAKVYDKSFKNKQHQERMELPSLPPGFYTIRVKADKQSYSNKYRIE